MVRSADIGIVGGGIVGLAHAYMALKKGHRVVLFERDQFPVGASVRNFGLVWPIGQESSNNIEWALRSRSHWLTVARDANIWVKQNGSLHLAYHDDEWDVLNEFGQLFPSRDGSFDFQLLDPESVFQHCPHVRRQELRGAMLSRTELTVDPPRAIRTLMTYLEQKLGLIVRRGAAVTDIDMPIVKTAMESWSVTKIFVCSGADLETLYPAVYMDQHITKCKLQMMKGTSKSIQSIGPSLCAGLTLLHYKAFSKCPSLDKVRHRYQTSNPQFEKHGIHVLVSQNDKGEIIIGDSHHYGQTLEPFDEESINQLILQYLRTFVEIDDLEITERWHGVYAKDLNRSNLTFEVEPGVTVVNALGGAGMTLSFGLAEQNIGKL